MTAGLPLTDARARAERERQVIAARDAQVVAFLTRTGNADLLPVLGLVDEHDDRADAGPMVCVRCAGPLPVHRTASGYCRKRVCQAARLAAQR